MRTRRSKIVSRATGRRAVTSVDHSRCAVVLKEIQRYHGPGLWAWRKNFFTPERHQFYNNTLSHIFGAIPWQVSQRLLLWTFWGWTAQEVLNPPFLTSKSYDEHLSPFLTKRSQNGSIFRCLFKREIFNFVYTNCRASSFTVMGNPYCQAPTLIWMREKAIQMTLNRIWRKINFCSLLV